MVEVSIIEMKEPTANSYIAPGGGKFTTILAIS